jgi:predicted ester cyclase
MSEENKALVRKVYEIIAGGGFARAEEVVNPDVADNECSLEMGRPKLIDTFEQFAAEVRTAFVDVEVTVEDMIAEGDRVAARVTMRGTHLVLCDD